MEHIAVSVRPVHGLRISPAAGRHGPAAYADFAKAIFGDLDKPAMTVPLTTKESDVAEGVWRGVNDTTGTLRFPAGADAVALAAAA